MNPSATDVAVVEEALFVAYRLRKDDLAARLGALALRMRSELVFACDIDESGGLAEVHELHAHSKKVS